MGKKSSRARKGKSAASKSASARAAPTPAFTPRPHGGGGGSGSSVSTPKSIAISASPSSLLPIPSAGASTSASSSSPIAAGFPVPPQAAIDDARSEEIVQLILDLQNKDLRANALAELYRKIETFHDLALFLWYSYGTITILLQEVLAIYAMFSSPDSLTPELSNRVCNVIALFQCIATHPDTRLPFLNARILIYLYQFLTPGGDSRPFQRLRHSILGVVTALMKDPDTEVIKSLLASQIMPLCLHTMDNGAEVSRTVATIFVQKLLQDDMGFDHIIHLPERLFAVLQALRNVVVSLTTDPSIRLLKLVIQCYVRLLDDPRSFWAMKNFIPTSLYDGTLDHCLNEDETARILLQKLLNNLQGPHIILGVINITMWMFSILLQ